MGTFEAHLFEEFQIAKRVAEATSTFVRKTGRFPLTGIGDINTYALFAELFFRLTCKSRRVIQNDHQDQLDAPTEAVTNFIEGRAGAIVPTGIAVDATTSKFFSHLVNNEMLATVYDFENREGLFVDVHRSSRFSVFVIGKEFNTQFAVFLLNPHDLEETERQVELKREEFRIFNPNTHTLPLFRARADRDLTRKVYQRMPILIRERPSNPDGNDNPWGLSFQRMYDMSNDSNHFRTAEQLTKKGYFREGADWRHEDGQVYVPLYEAKMIHHFDHRFGSFAGLNKTSKRQ